MKKSLILLLLLASVHLFAQNNFHLVQIGDFKTTGGGIISKCKIGYRTIGKLNSDKSNVVLWLTWFSGTSEDIAKNTVPTLVDSSQYYVIVLDALGNGVSSSPSNAKNFPAISIRDMVNTEYELLTKYLNINHVHSVAGISMGGMQTLEWLVAYPDFMDKAVSIVGTPKQSFYDLLLWQTELELIKHAEKSGDKDEIEFTRKRLADIDIMHLYTPSYFVRTKIADSLKPFLTEMYKERNDISNLGSQIEAMMGQDIYISSSKNSSEIKNVIKAKVLLIISLQDHMVNPQGCIELSKQISCQLEPFDCDCGHNLFSCSNEKAKKVIGSFLKQN
jgi:homoserine O-acetyltransferase/O-succinyltransferase